ncbi:MAG: DNA polymerase III delta' subunit [Candidatus Saganbacteria bacterium]|uniref:DNA polymerase III delta' subunit n=1 Tax=Candidatus Saganbacteria bacterium TaxID=2575572 RepID=A0A833L1R5_UNCSA|nr:MAG: DNA polymerase III delta' subunit [Candidatus Saganbacteria bacterium]
MMKNRVEKIFSGIIKTQRIASAYLLLGGLAQEKLDSALFFAKSLNCESQISKPCNSCLSCRKLSNSTHPDLIIIEKDGASIKIEQIRKLKEFMHYGPSEGTYKIVVVNNADAITSDAANSFLKMLEEPPSYSTYLLVSQKEEGLLPTIISRCQKIIFPEQSEYFISEQSKTVFEKLTGNNYVETSNAVRSIEDPVQLLEELFALCAQSQRYKLAKKVLYALKNIKMGSNKKLIIDWMCINKWNLN